MKLFEVFLTYLAVSSSKPVAAMRSLPPNIILFDLFPSSSQQADLDQEGVRLALYCPLLLLLLQLLGSINEDESDHSPASHCHCHLYHKYVLHHSL